MATIRASCRECGDVELTTGDVHVRTCLDDGSGTYRFRCPVCRMTEVKSADDRTVQLLVSAGVSYSEWTLPAELQERPMGDAITHDDLLDFHTALSGDDWTSLFPSSPER